MSHLPRRTRWVPASVVALAGLSAAAAVLPPSVARAETAASASPGLAGIYQISSSSSLVRLHPIAGVAVPDALSMDFGYAHTELQATPLGLALAGPAYIPAAGLLSAVGLPSLPPNAIPTCGAAAPDGESEASCVGPAVDGGGGNTLFAANGNATSHVVPEDPAQSLVTASATSGGATGFGFGYAGGQANARSYAAESGWISTADVSITGLNIAGVVTIDAIKSFARAVANGVEGSGVSERGLEVLGVRVLGTPVVITTEGVQVADHGSEADSRAAQDAVDSALERAGLSIRLIPPPNRAAARPGTDAAADSGGVAVRAILPGLPPGNEAQIIFGRSAAEVSAHQAPTLGTAGAPSGPAVTADPASPGEGRAVIAELPTTTDSALAPGTVLATGGVPHSTTPGAGLGALASGAAPSTAVGTGLEPSVVRRVVAVRYFADGDCGLMCAYTIFGGLGFILPVAYITRRYLLGV